MGNIRQTQPRRRGFNRYRVVAKQHESTVITSFVLAPSDSASDLGFRPGQYLTVGLEQADGTVLLRNYSLSGDARSQSHLRISVKRELAPWDRPDLPPGVGSNYLHDCVQEGDQLDIAGPTGSFVLDEDSARPVVLFSGGVGITPLLSMLHWLSNDSTRPVYFIHACENGAVHAFRDEVLKLARRRQGIAVHFCYRNPRADDQAGSDYHSQGLLSRKTLQQLLPLDDYDVYLCGPRPFMQANWRLLRGLGVAAQRIHYEFFGPATILDGDEVRPDTPPAVAAAEPARTDTARDGSTSVHFLPSGTTVAWEQGCHSLLELAEQAGLAPSFNCRAGLCNACRVGLLEGEVEYFEAPLDTPDNGEVLLCCARPFGAVTLDLRR